MLRRILVVDSVDFRSLNQDVAVEFERAENGGGVGSEIGVARSRDGNDHSPLFQMLDGAALDEEFAHAVDFECAHDAYFPAVALYGVTKGDAVDDRGEHSHVVALRTIQSLSRHRRATEDVASSDDDDDFLSRIRKGDDLFRKGVEEFYVDTVSCGALEGFAGKLEKVALGVLDLHGREG